jgi:hypothetical protein
MSGRTIALVLGLTALPSLVVFPFAENVAGDAVVRSWLAHAWLERPHLIGSSLQGCLQFGPLHFPLMALVEWLTGNAHLAGRLLSLIVGTFAALPLFSLTRRLFSVRAAWWAVAVFAMWPLRIQTSTTAASEALSGLLVLSSLSFLARSFEGSERQWCLLSALCLTLGAAVRYDVWLWIPLLTVLVWARSGSFARGLGFGAVAASFPIAWLLGHLVDTGDVLYPLNVVNDYHRTWFQSELTIWGEPGYRLIVLLFWPITALVTFTPLATAAGAFGLVRAWRTTARWLVVVAVVPALAMSLRGVLLSSFVPLSRFTMKELSVFVVFIGAGLATLEIRRRWLAFTTLALLVVSVPAIDAAARHDWKWAGSFQAVSALSRNAPDVRAMARLLRERGPDSSVLVVEVDPRGFDDLQVSFESGWAFERVARRRAPTFEARAGQGEQVRWVVSFDGAPPAPTLPGRPFVEVARSGAIRLLERAP